MFPGGTVEGWGEALTAPKTEAGQGGVREAEVKTSSKETLLLSVCESRSLWEYGNTAP